MNSISTTVDSTCILVPRFFFGTSIQEKKNLGTSIQVLSTVMIP